MSYLFSENKWYLVSPLNDGNWSTVVNDWYAASNITGATFYRLIYKLKAPVTHGVALTNDNWESIDIDSISNTANGEKYASSNEEASLILLM